MEQFLQAPVYVVNNVDEGKCKHHVHFTHGNSKSESEDIAKRGNGNDRRTLTGVTDKRRKSISMASVAESNDWLVAKIVSRVQYGLYLGQSGSGNAIRSRKQEAKHS